MDHGAYGDSPQANALRASVTQRGIARIYHYTAAEHLESIFRYGAIFCRRELNVRGIQYHGHGWGYSGKEEELQDYVVCGFMPHWGMIKDELRSISVIELDASLIWRAGTIFCSGNSASNEFNIVDLEAADRMTTFESLFPDAQSNWPTNYQSEVLVRDAVEIEYFKRLLFSHQEHRDHFIERARAGLRANPGPELNHSIGFAVDPRKFPPGFNPPFSPGGNA